MYTKQLSKEHLCCYYWQTYFLLCGRENANRITQPTCNITTLRFSMYSATEFDTIRLQAFGVDVLLNSSVQVSATCIRLHSNLSPKNFLFIAFVSCFVVPISMTPIIIFLADRWSVMNLCSLARIFLFLGKVYSRISWHF